MKTSSTHGQDDVAEYPDKSHTPWKGCCCRTADKYPTPWKAFHLHRGNAAAQPESSTLCKAAIAPRVKVPQVVAVYAADFFSPRTADEVLHVIAAPRPCPTPWKAAPLALSGCHTPDPLPTQAPSEENIDVKGQNPLCWQNVRRNWAIFDRK